MDRTDTAEARLARVDRDRQRTAAGWIAQDRSPLNTLAESGVEVREGSIPGAGEADYLLITGGNAIGILEAKLVDTTLTCAEIQTANYA